MNRRRFITALGAVVGLVVAEPVRRYWFVGANLSRRDRVVIRSYAEMFPNLCMVGDETHAVLTTDDELVGVYPTLRQAMDAVPAAIDIT